VGNGGGERRREEPAAAEEADRQRHGVRHRAVDAKSEVKK
jgi:hypothetical protein